MTTVEIPSNERPALPRGRRIWQVAGLGIGFALGQGLTFLTQTYLLSQGHTVLIGEFAVGLGIVTLTQWFADLGGLNLMSGKHDDHRFVSSVLVARFCAALFIVLLTPFCTTWITTPFAQGVVETGRYVAIIWAFNLTGLLDGARRSGQAGLISFGPWLGCNLATIWIAPTMSFSTGQFVGLGFVIGAVVTVAMQYVIGRDLLKFVPPNASDVIAYLRHGGTCALTYATALTYSRVLLFIVYATCEAATTGAFAFIRSLISSLQQALTFVRRTEYPDLVTSSVGGLAKTLRMQSTSIALSGVIAVGAVCCYPLATLLLPTKDLDIARSAIAFVVTLPFWCVASALGQQFLAKHKTQVNFVVIMLGAILSLTLTTCLLTNFGILAIAFAELTMFVFTFLAYWFAYRRVFA
ncbi:MAG: hypothetical protein R3C05_13740 [Pirellulaceae bacterium]